jgi:hypothetical protein
VTLRPHFHLWLYPPAASPRYAASALVGRLATDMVVAEMSGGSRVDSFIPAVDRTSEEADFALLEY